MKILITLLFFFALPFNMVAQNNYIYVNSKEALNSSIDSLSQELFLYKLSNENDTSIRTLLNSKLLYLNKYKTDTIPFIFPQERVICLYLARDFETILSEVKDTTIISFLNKRKDMSSKKMLFNDILPKDSRYFTIYDDLLNRLMDNKNIINEDIQSSNRKPEDKEFLNLLLTTILAYNDLKHFNTDSIAIVSVNYINKFKDSPYNSYIKENVIPGYRTMNGSFALDIYKGVNYLNGNISKFFSGSAITGVDAAIGYKKLFLEFEAVILYNNKYSYPTIYFPNGFIGGNTYERDVYYESIQRLNISCQVYSNNIISISPFAGFSFHEINSSIYYWDTISIYNPTSYNLGINLEFKLPKFKIYRKYSDCFCNKYDNSYNYFRITAGYSPMISQSDGKFNGSSTYFNFGVGRKINPSRKIIKNE